MKKKGIKDDYSCRDVVVYTKHDDLRKDITNANIVEYDWVIEGYFACNCG